MHVDACAFPSYFRYRQCSHQLSIKHILCTFLCFSISSFFFWIVQWTAQKWQISCNAKIRSISSTGLAVFWSGNCSSAFFVCCNCLFLILFFFKRCSQNAISIDLISCLNATNETKNILRNYLVISTHQLLFFTQKPYFYLSFRSLSLSLVCLSVMQNEQYSLWLNNRRIKTCFLTTSSNFSPNPYTNSITSFPHSITMKKPRKNWTIGTKYMERDYWVFRF